MRLLLLITVLCILKVVQSATIWSCNFDANTFTPCGMTQSTQDTQGFDWRPRKDGTDSKNTGPSQDHTSGEGYYMYIEASDHNPGEFADLDTPSLSEASNYCATFWFHMFGQHIGSLAVIAVTSSGNTQELWKRTREGATGVGAWQTDNVTLPGDTLKVRFRAVRGGVNDGQPYGDIAIDDVIIENIACGAPEVTTESPTTEKSTTTQSTSTSTTPTTTVSTSTSPSTTESTSTQTESITTVSTSTTTEEAEDTTTGTTNSSGDDFYTSEEITTEGFLQSTSTMFSSSTTESSTLSSSNTTLSILPSSSTLLSILSSSTTEVPNTNLSTMSPSSTPLYSESSSTMTPSKTSRSSVASTTEDSTLTTTRRKEGLSSTSASVPSDAVTESSAVLFRCEFTATDMCGLVQSGEMDDFDWELHRGYTLSEPTGPRVDHTTGSDQGYYLYAEASDREVSDRAIIAYPTNDLQQTTCMNFWYHMFGQHVRTLKVTGVKVGGEVSTLWQQSGDQGDQWFSGYVTVTEEMVKIQFIAIRGGEEPTEVQGDIALDDLMLRTGPCSLYTTTESTSSVSTTTEPTEETDSPEELWGLEDTYWIVILAVAGSVIVILLIVIVCQACALSNSKNSTTAQISRRTGGDFDNFDGYTKYSGANGNGATPSSSSAPGYINAYENGAYNP